MSEVEELRRIGATPTKNSGRGKHNKGDGILGNYTIDVKEYAESYGVSRKGWAKITRDAIANGNEPIIKIVLGQSGKQRLRLVVMEESTFMELYGIL